MFPKPCPRQHPHTLRTSPQSLVEQRPSSTVNDVDVAYFSCLSAVWWDEHGDFAPLYQMYTLRMCFVREKLLLDPLLTRVSNPFPVLAGLDVLDVGCGGGILSEVSFYHFFYSL